MMRTWWSAFFILVIAIPAFGNRFDFSDLSKDLQEQIKRQFPSLSTGQFTPRDLDLLLEELIVKNQFDSAEIVQNGEVFSVRLGRTSRIDSVQFSGNSSVSEKDLRREMVISEKSPFDQQQLIEAQDRLERFYKIQGFSQVRIDFEFDRPKDRGVNIRIRIREGQQTTLNLFIVNSKNKELNQTLTRNFRGFLGQPLNERTLNELRNSLRIFLSEKSYFRTEVSDPELEPIPGTTQTRATYKFQNVNKYEVYFEGQKERSADDLRGVLALNTFSSSNPNVAAELGTKIKAYYTSIGFARVEVTTEEKPGAGDFQRKIYIRVKEGPRVRLAKIEWTGVFSEKPEVYQKFVESHSSDTVSKRIYVKDDLDAGLRNLVTDRWNRGYLKARIVSTRAIYNDKKDQVTLQVNFEEGRLTQIRNVIFEGNKEFTTIFLTELVDLSPGEPLRLYELEAAIGRLYRHYRGSGYLDMALSNEKDDVVTYMEDNSLVDVRFRIQEGPQVRVGSIVIEGNSLTKDEIILRELEFDYGNILTPEKIDESTSRLQRTGYFSSVEIRTLEEKTPIALRTVRVRVVDRDPGLFNFGFGINNDRGFTLRGYTGLAYRNIAGTGRGISARADTNYNITEVKLPEWKFTVGYLEPYVFNSRLRFRTNLTLSRSITDFDPFIVSDVDQYTFSLEQNITSNLLVSWDLWNFANYKDTNIDDRTETILRIGNTGPTIDLDFRDHPFNPTRGTFTRLTGEYGSPLYGSNDTIEFIKAQGSFTHYQSLGVRDMVWANSLRAGYIKNNSGKSDGSVPYDKKGLTLGGQSTIRGFTPDEAFPNLFDFPINDPSQYVVGPRRFLLKTEAQMGLFKSEIRFPIIGNFAGGIFYDGGSVRIKGIDSSRPYRDSFGIAARYTLPVGALNVEYAWKNRPEGNRNESPQVLHISFGTF